MMYAPSTYIISQHEISSFSLLDADIRKLQNFLRMMSQIILWATKAILRQWTVLLITSVDANLAFRTMIDDWFCMYYL